MSDKREPWQPQCPEIGADGEPCELAEGHEGHHESPNCIWGYTVYPWVFPEEDGA